MATVKYPRTKHPGPARHGGLDDWYLDSYDRPEVKVKFYQNEFFGEYARFQLGLNAIIVDRAELKWLRGEIDTVLRAALDEDVPLN